MSFPSWRFRPGPGRRALRLQICQERRAPRSFRERHDEQSLRRGGFCSSSWRAIRSLLYQARGALAIATILTSARNSWAYSGVLARASSAKRWRASQLMMDPPSRGCELFQVDDGSSCTTSRQCEHLSARAQNTEIGRGKLTRAIQLSSLQTDSGGCACGSLGKKGSALVAICTHALLRRGTQPVADQTCFRCWRTS